MEILDAGANGEPGGEIGTIHDLMETLNHWSAADSDVNHLLLVSFTTLGMPDQQEGVQQALEGAFLSFVHSRGGHVFKLSDLDTAILIKLADFNRVEAMMDLKVDIMRVIQHHLPEHFSKIDQTRLIRPIDLAVRLDTAKRFLEAYGDRRRETAVDEKGERPLNMQDIQKLRDALRKLGPREFGKRYIRSQTAARIVPGKAAQPVMTEYYVGVDLLKQSILRGVDIRGTGNVFNQLTLTFDQALLYCIGAVTGDRTKKSLNMNVETVFTNAFDHFLRDAGDKGLADVIIEFRQDNMFQHFSQFQTACELIHKKGGAVAIDNVQPETLGLVNLHRLNVKLAKVMWRGDAEDTLLHAKDDIHAMQDSGTAVVLAHVDDEQAIKIGQSLGIALFQGYHVDKLLTGAAPAKGGS
ncbi:MAG: hypothetical protein COW30_00195 [Rhodospirillales bacterium CG15_BIG_FIL_POST_REV_8_21_14_020_66_15]|nr:MAG: hypothetical protein COW30_00195 [Rhodospirillales bacterium CG15_BIG_FIL_POST_REV_8_21_14_020_66_15]